MTNPLEIDVFWSFRSPYSYLATGRLVALHARYALDVNVPNVLIFDGAGTLLAVHSGMFRKSYAEALQADLEPEPEPAAGS